MPITTRGTKAAAAGAAVAGNAACDKVAAAKKKHAEKLAKRRIYDKARRAKKKKEKMAAAAASAAAAAATGDTANDARTFPAAAASGAAVGAVAVSTSIGLAAEGKFSSPAKSNPNYSNKEKELVVRMGMAEIMVYAATYTGPKGQKKAPLQDIADLLNNGFHQGRTVRTWKGVQSLIARLAKTFVDYQLKLAHSGKHARGADGENANDDEDIEAPEFWNIVAPYWHNVKSGGVDQMKAYDQDEAHKYDGLAEQVNADAAIKRRKTTPNTKKKKRKLTATVVLSSDSSDGDDSDRDDDDRASKPPSHAQLKDMRDANKKKAAKSAAKKRNGSSGSASEQASKRAKAENTRHTTKKQKGKTLSEKAFASINELVGALSSSLKAGTQDGGRPIAANVPVAAAAVDLRAPLDPAAKRAKADQQMKMLQEMAAAYNLSEAEVMAHRKHIVSEMLS